MSTRSTLVSGEDAHLFQDLLVEDDAVYLTLRGEGIWYKASPGEVTIKIPAHVWGAIRGHEIRLDLVDLSDDDLLFMVDTEVSKRIEEYERAESKSVRALLDFYGSMVFGAASEPRPDQIRQGLEYYTKERTRQREVQEKMKQFQVYRREEDE